MSKKKIEAIRPNGGGEKKDLVGCSGFRNKKAGQKEIHYRGEYSLRRLRGVDG